MICSKNNNSSASPRLITSQKGNPKLYHMGYYYTRTNRKLKTTTNWICSQYWNIKCRASCIIRNDGTTVTRGTHQHPPTEDEFRT